jgi:alkylation response protein AidB-like acyl-CoA dehydrogenase
MTGQSAQPDVSIRSRELLAKVAEMLPLMRQDACKLDRESGFPETEIEKLGASGALAAVVPVPFGGLGMGTEPSGAEPLFDLLRLLGRGNLAVGRIFEGHVNALALVALYGTEEQIAQAAQDALSGHLFAVWNSEPADGLCLVEHKLKGCKIFCSAAGYATRALVTAKQEGGESRMLLLELQQGERVEPLPFRPHGMRAAATGKMVLDGLSVVPNAFIGEIDDYIKEPAFSAGAWRASAVAIGGLETLIEEARTQLLRARRHLNPHQQARMGRTFITQETARMWGVRAALIAEAADGASEDKAAFVNLARCAIEAATAEAMRLVQCSLGLSAFLEPNPVERLMRDLGTYLRQPAPDEALTEAAAWFMEKDRGIERLGSIIAPP